MDPAKCTPPRVAPSFEIVYAGDFDNIQGNILQANDDFMRYISTHSKLDIEGQLSQDFVFATEQFTYKLSGINLPTTLLVVDSQSLMEFSPSKQKGGKAATVRTQKHNYLKIEPFQSRYHSIYKQLLEDSPTEDEIMTESAETLFAHYAVSFATVSATHKISPREFIKFCNVAPFIQSKQRYLFISLPVVLAVMRKVLPLLLENQMGVSWFVADIITNALSLIHPDLFGVVANIIGFEWRQESGAKEYRLTREAVVRFVLLELGQIKHEYILEEINQVARDTIEAYLPAEHSRVDLQEVYARELALCFFTIPKGKIVVCRYYDPLLVEWTIKGRLSFISSIKNRFNQYELRGIFSKMVDPVDLSDVLLKNFRKFGAEYEPKLVMSK